MKRSAGGWIEGLSLAEHERLILVFRVGSNMGGETDRNILEYLEQQQASHQRMADLRAKHGYDEWGGKP